MTFFIPLWAMIAWYIVGYILAAYFISYKMIGRIVVFDLFFNLIYAIVGPLWLLPSVWIAISMIHIQIIEFFFGKRFF